jgi:hypothetical protein
VGLEGELETGVGRAREEDVLLGDWRMGEAYETGERNGGDASDGWKTVTGVSHSW